MSRYDQILADSSSKLLKSIDHLEYSYNKIKSLPDTLSEMDDEIMETWESFSSRFSRTSDMFIMCYIRTKIAIEEPGFTGSSRDYINKAEKFNLIEKADDWITIRELRNMAAHKYNDDDLTALYRKLKELCPILLAIRHVIQGIKGAK